MFAVHMARRIGPICLRPERCTFHVSALQSFGPLTDGMKLEANLLTELKGFLSNVFVHNAASLN